MAPPGPVEHTRSAHSGRPAHAPVLPVLYVLTTRPSESYSVVVVIARPAGSWIDFTGRPLAQSYTVCTTRVSPCTPGCSRTWAPVVTLVTWSLTLAVPSVGRP